ncbi:hypothetical protein [[Actinomadura] parvosata]|uniref:hypothetical protein n=1 Tax=[Actinomadura] parvosata TaxID=1955412 RepID=UPI0012BBCF1D|nr:hypothetical protein [Nonomuraea sp. ATCC 55076]
MLLWARGHRVPFGPYVGDAAAWGMVIGVVAAGVALAGTRVVPGGGPKERGGTFWPRAWVVPCLAVGWSVVWSVLVRERGPLLGWLPLSFRYFEQVAVVLAAVVVASVEGALRRRMPVEGRPGRAFVLAWVALSVAPVVYAAVVAVDGGMRELLLAAPLSAAWVGEYAGDVTGVLAATPAQTALPPLVLAMVAVGVQRVLPARQREAAPVDPVRTDRRWALLVAGAAVALTYACVAVTSRFPMLTRRTYDSETPVTVRAVALLAPPDAAVGRVAVVWSWAIAAVFAVAAAVLVYVAARGQLVRVFPASFYPVLVAALALAAALAWSVGSLTGLVVTGEWPAGIRPADEAAAFVVFGAPVFGAVLFIVYSQVGVSRFARVVELEGEQAWERLAERYREWKEQVRGHVPGRRERAIIAARAAGGALVLLVVAGAGQVIGSVRGVEVPVADGLTGVAYLGLLAALVYVGLAKVNVRERRWSVWLTVWGMSVLAGTVAGTVADTAVGMVAGLGTATALGPEAGLGTATGLGPEAALGTATGLGSEAGVGSATGLGAVTGLGTPVGLVVGLVAGPFAVAGVAVGVAVAVPKKVLVAGGVVLALVAAVPLVVASQARGPLAFETAGWRERLPGVTIDVSYPRAAGAADAARVNAALVAPVRAYVDEALRRHRRNPQAGAALTGSYVLVRNDAGLVSVRYALTGELGRAVTYDRRAGRTLTVRDVFAPAAFTPAGRRRLADAVRPLVPKGLVPKDHSPRTVSVDGDRLLVALAPGAVELTFGRDYFCVPCAPFTVRVPDGRLPGLVIRRS